MYGFFRNPISKFFNPLRCFFEVDNFILETQYACPRIVKTFQEHMTKFKEFMGLKRNKKKVPQFREY